MEIILGIVLMAALIYGSVRFVKARKAGKLDWLDNDPLGTGGSDEGGSGSGGGRLDRTDNDKL